MKRVAISELLDSDSGTPAEVTASLSDLRHINHWFGGMATTLSLVERVAEATSLHSLSLLEVASGSGDVPANVQRRMAARGIEVKATLLDRVPSHLNGVGASGHAVAADALAIPFADSSFDVVSTCLFVHHLRPEHLVEFVNEALRVCRIAVIINDLVRSPLHLSLVYLSLPLYHSRLTYHDAPASVRQAYTVEEMEDMLQRTRTRRAEIQRHFLFRMGVIAWKE
jgi:ubiquinone/menaquinone biosynthesis C-methylase UbiE